MKQTRMMRDRRDKNITINHAHHHIDNTRNQNNNNYNPNYDQTHRNKIPRFATTDRIQYNQNQRENKKFTSKQMSNTRYVQDTHNFVRYCAITQAIDRARFDLLCCNYPCANKLSLFSFVNFFLLGQVVTDC